MYTIGKDVLCSKAGERNEVGIAALFTESPSRLSGKGRQAMHRIVEVNAMPTAEERDVAIDDDNRESASGDAEGASTPGVSPLRLPVVIRQLRRRCPLV